MPMKTILSILTTAVFLALTGCSTVKDGKAVRAPAQAKTVCFASMAAAVSPGVVVSAPVPYGSAGNVAICVKWSASQAALEGKAQWWVSAQHPITSTGVFDIGTYVVHFGACSVAGYTPPPAKTIAMNVPNKMVTMTVTYGH